MVSKSTRIPNVKKIFSSIRGQVLKVFSMLFKCTNNLSGISKSLHKQDGVDTSCYTFNVNCYYVENSYTDHEHCSHRAYQCNKFPFLETIYKYLRSGLLLLFSWKNQMDFTKNISSKSWTKAPSDCIEQTTTLLMQLRPTKSLNLNS